MMTHRASVGRMVSLQLVALALSALACATNSKQTESDMTALSKQIASEPGGSCEDGLKQAAAHREHAMVGPFYKKTESKGFHDLSYRAAARCESQADAQARLGMYVGAVASLDAVRRLLPERFPKKERRSGGFTSHATMLGKLNKWSPLAAEQQKTYDALLAAYKEVNPAATPALAYHKHLELLRATPPSLAEADRLAAEHKALLARLNQTRALAYTVGSPDADARTADILKRHRAQIKASKDLVIVGDGDSPYATLSVRFGKPTTSDGRASATYSQRYITGKKTVKNDRYFSAKSKIERLQKDYAWQSKTYNSIRCTKGSYKPKTCARAYYQKMQSLQKSIQQEQRNLKDGPTKVITLHADYKYPVDRPYREIKLPVEITVRWPGEPSRKPVILKDVASVRGSATIHKAYPKYGVRAVNTPIPSDDTIMDGVHNAAAGMIANAANKVRLDRAQQPAPAQETPAQEADRWITAFCVRAGLSLYKEREAALKAMTPAARALLDSRERCDMDDYYNPLNGKRLSKEPKTLEIIRLRDQERARAEARRQRK